VARDAARISAADRGWLLGDGAFETLRADAGVPAFLDAHLERLAGALDQLAIDLPWSERQLESFVARVLKANRLTKHPARIRITVSRGAIGSRQPTLVVSAERYTPPVLAAYDRGVAVEISRWTRHPHPLHRIKSTSAMANLWQRREASHEAVFDVLQFNTLGHLAEGSYTNVFTVDADGTIRTPAITDGCLPGIARGVVVDLVLESGRPVLEGCIDRERLRAAAEIFLTNSLIEVLGVASIDGREVGDGKPRSVTRALAAAYALRVRGVVHDP
jgi:branched-subunit amino acid aminotransferase/4-amino-4-deoxychorismate lyase